MGRYALLVIALSFQLFSQTRRDDLSFMTKVRDVDSKSKSMLLESKNSNIKFFKRNDEVFFFNELNPSFKCRGIVQKGTFRQLKIRVPDFSKCSKYVGMVKGSYLKINSKDLAINLTMAEEVVDILLKKRMILKNKIYRLQNRMKNQGQRKEILDTEYESKMNALKIEWKDAIEKLGLDDKDAEKEINLSKMKLQDIDSKLKLYNIQDQKIQNSKWSLKYDVEDI